GYYLGQQLGEWSDNPGSSATQKKGYIGKGQHFYPKTNIAEFLIEAYDLEVGDKVLIQGPTTGSQEMVVEEMVVDKKEGATKAMKSDVITFKTDFRVRPSDKLYKVVQSLWLLLPFNEISVLGVTIAKSLPRNTFVCLKKTASPFC